MNKDELQLIDDVRQIVSVARQHAYRAVNVMQVISNWLIGRRIVEQEQNGLQRADYGKHIVEVVSQTLTAEYGKGYSKTNISNFRRFYVLFKNLQIRQALPDEFVSLLPTINQALPDESRNQQIPSAESVSPIPLYPQIAWTHYERLIRVANEEARIWYLREAASENWSYRTLDRNINTQYYNRLLLSQQKGVVRQEMKEKTAAFQQNAVEYVKNPVIAEFLGIAPNVAFKETELENAILDNLQQFLMELGKGYAFVARQQHLRTEENDYYIDLVFYNYILRCFVLIDLKVDKLSFQDVGQMDMYLRLYDQYKRREGDNPTIGIVLCSETDGDVARFSSLADNDKMYAAKYLTYLPTQEELRREIEQQKEIFEMRNNNPIDGD